MIGTSPAVTRPIDLMPPMSTTRVSTVSTAPVIQAGIDQLDSTLAAIELPWVILPMPKQARTAKIANMRPSTLPSGPLIPCSR